MSHFEYKQFYERRFPHIHPPDATFFITFRLAGSIPQAVIREYKAKKDWLESELKRARSKENETQLQSLLEFRRFWFKRFEDVLDKAKDSPVWLGVDEIRQIVAGKLREDEPNRYRLDAFCIMPNHVHVVLKPNLSQINLREDKTKQRPIFVSEEKTLPQIMQSLKGVTARRANLFLNRTGSFWDIESYDHFIRDDAEFNRIVKYVLNNPVKAGLVNHWQDWRGNFLAQRLRERF